MKAQTSTLDINAIKSTALGLKDTKTSVTAVWDKLFKVPAKKRQKGIEDNTSGKYITPLVKDITTCGEYDKLAQSKRYVEKITMSDKLMPPPSHAHFSLLRELSPREDAS